VLPELPKVDCLITDPPYGVLFKGKRNKDKIHNNGYAEKIGDDMDFIHSVVIPVIENLTAKCKRSAIFMSNKNIQIFPKAKDIGCFYVQYGGGIGPWGFNSVNLILYYGKDPYLERGAGSRPNSWMVSGVAEKNGHPCPKPLGWMHKIVTRASLRGETILDPFMGSGTTLRAAKDLGRKAIGIEISEEYCRIAVNRLRQEVLSL
jgi:site-specific DNA-methyltransferase (adenine-specific)